MATAVGYREAERGVVAMAENRPKDALPLFAAAAEPAHVFAAEPSAVDRALAELDLDGMSPREAMDALYRLKGLII